MKIQHRYSFAAVVVSTTSLMYHWNVEKFFYPANHVREVEPKKVRKNNDAPIIEDWVSDDEDEVETTVMVKKKTVILTAAKIEKQVRKPVRYVKKNQLEKPYNWFLRTAIQRLSMEVSTIRLMLEFPTEAGVATVKSDYPRRDASLVATMEEGNIREIVLHPIPGDTLSSRSSSSTLTSHINPSQSVPTYHL
ncbi:hypothetical protein Tco_0471259, partial [Tanacetum coccineum]